MRASDDPDKSIYTRRRPLRKRERENDGIERHERGVYTSDSDKNIERQKNLVAC